MKLSFDPLKHEYKIGKKVLPSVTTILKAAGYIDTTWATEWHRNKGEQLHRALHLHDLDVLDEATLDPELVPYIQTYKRFLSESGAKVTHSELPCWSDKYQYAGTADKVLLLHRRRVVVDVKTNNAPAWTALQVASYAHAIEESRYIHIERRYSLALKKDDYRFRECRDAQDFPKFLKARNEYDSRISND